MTPELGLALPPLLLALALLAGGFSLGRASRPWRRVALLSRLGAAAALGAILLYLGLADRSFLFSSPLQTTLGLAFAALAVHLALAWRLGTHAAAPAVDLIALLLSLWAALLGYSGLRSAGQGGLGRGAPALAAGSTPDLIVWALVLAGAGSLLVACGAGAMLGLRAILGRVRVSKHLDWIRHEEQRAALGRVLFHATHVALLTLGTSVLLVALQSRQSLGALTGGSALEIWCAVLWLLTAAGLLAQCTGRHGLRWCAFLVSAAAVLALLVLLAGPLPGILGTV